MIDWQGIDTVFLDMDGTLLDLHFDNHFWLEHIPLRYSQTHNVSVEAAKDKLFPRMIELKGKLDWYCTDFWSKELRLPIIKLKQEVADRIRLRPYVEPFLKFLQHSDKTVVLFTNAHEDTVTLKMNKTELAPYFDRVFTSHQLGVPKEDDRAWDKLGEQHDFDRSQSLFIDDNFDVLRSAERHGVAELLGIALPDLYGKALESNEFRLLNCFSEITPT